MERQEVIDNAAFDHEGIGIDGDGAERISRVLVAAI